MQGEKYRQQTANTGIRVEPLQIFLFRKSTAYAAAATHCHPLLYGRVAVNRLQIVDNRRQ